VLSTVRLQPYTLWPVTHWPPIRYRFQPYPYRTATSWMIRIDNRVAWFSWGYSTMCWLCSIWNDCERILVDLSLPVKNTAVLFNSCCSLTTHGIRNTATVQLINTATAQIGLSKSGSVQFLSKSCDLGFGRIGPLLVHTKWISSSDRYLCTGTTGINFVNYPPTGVPLQVKFSGDLYRLRLI
jgi:hypothetical protein